MNIEVTMKNYGQILRYLKPKLKSYMFAWAKEFQKDITDIEDVVYKSLEEAINRFDKERALKFESYFILITRTRLINSIRDGGKDTGFMLRFRNNPCEVCSKTCEEKCYKYKMYYRGRLSMNAEEQRDAKDFTEILAEQEHRREVIQTFLNSDHRYKCVFEHLMKEIEDGYIGRRALARAVKKTCKEQNMTRYGVYKQVTNIQKRLKDISAELLAVT